MFKSGKNAVAITAKAGAFASILALYGCGGSAEDADRADLATPGGPIEAEAYAGALRLRVADSFPTEDGTDLPVALYLGLVPETETRLGINAFLDLRDIQNALPELLSGKIEADCSLDLDIDFIGARAEGTSVRATASVDASLFRCSGHDTPQERRGFKLLTQTIDVEALASASLQGDCVSIELADLQLEPRGLIGGMANLFGVTKTARSAILSAVETKLAENPICPDLPDALDLLAPRYSASGLREIGDGGLGAALSGSFDLSAATIVELLSLAQAEGILPAPSEVLPAPENGPGVSYQIAETFDLLETEVPYGLDIRLAAVGTTRIGAEAQLDLRKLQEQLPDLLSDTDLIDNCGVSTLPWTASKRKPLARA